MHAGELRTAGHEGAPKSIDESDGSIVVVVASSQDGRMEVQSINQSSELTAAAAAAASSSSSSSRQAAASSIGKKREVLVLHFSINTCHFILFSFYYCYVVLYF